MRVSRGVKLGAVAAAAAMVLAACSSSSSNSPAAARSGGSTSASSAAKKSVKVGLAYDVGGRGDKSFNDLAAAGLEKAKADLGRPDRRN